MVIYDVKSYFNAIFKTQAWSLLFSKPKVISFLCLCLQVGGCINCLLPVVAKELNTNYWRKEHLFCSRFKRTVHHTREDSAVGTWGTTSMVRMQRGIFSSFLLFIQSRTPNAWNGVTRDGQVLPPCPSESYQSCDNSHGQSNLGGKGLFGLYFHITIHH